jgi:regulator of replication initiation timing
MLKNLKSLFIVEDEETAKTKAPEKTPARVEVPKTAPVIKQSVAGEPGKVSAKFSDVLLAAMERDNQEGFDYMEFKQSLKSLASMPMDEATRYQSALAMAKTLGATPAKLLESAAHYLNVLKIEENKFEHALAKQQEEKIGQKGNEQEQLKKVINEKMETIKRLNLEIENHKKQLDVVQKDMEEAAKKVETTKNDFIASYNSLVAQIQTDIDNLKKFTPTT